VGKEWKEKWKKKKITGRARGVLGACVVGSKQARNYGREFSWVLNRFPGRICPSSPARGFAEGSGTGAGHHDCAP